MYQFPAARSTAAGLKKSGRFREISQRRVEKSDRKRTARRYNIGAMK
jgi:hypothetical protein